MNNETTAIILAGGSSSRMGENKALLRICGKSVIKIMIEKVESLFKNILIITNEPEVYNKFGLKMYEDVYPGHGPLSGVHSGLKHSTTHKNFFISCDLPLMSTEAIEYINNYDTEKPIVLYKNQNYIEKLCGIYSKECEIAAEKLLTESAIDTSTGKFNASMSSLIALCDKEIIEFESLPFYNPNTFLNMNTKEDYKKILKLIDPK